MLLGKGAVLVVVFVRKSPLFGDETLSRRRFCAEISTFWRRVSFSSSFLCRKLHFLATTPLLIVFLGPEISTFWRRDSFSSSFLCGNLHFLATRLILVVVFGRKTHFFGDETHSRRRFWTENPLFWRRDPFSSSLLDGKPAFLATRPFLVVAFGRKTPFFGDDTLSRRRFCAEISTFWRRNSFSSPFWDRKRYFLATTLILVAFFAPEPPLFGDETLSRRRFWTENPLFWRRHPLSSSFCGGKLYFLATRPFLVVVFAPETSFFGDNTLSRRLFEAENFLFW
ncbi:hypothetical protein [Caldifermentibacillus hisashii]|uniref:hypothetical protein n=1 Tax=Caldifermentibacillus hisashii TaxID=996558 RepID=UPI0031B67114